MCVASREELGRNQNTTEIYNQVVIVARLLALCQAQRRTTISDYCRDPGRLQYFRTYRHFLSEFEPKLGLVQNLSHECVNTLWKA